MDDELVFESQVSPRPPLGLVIWIDNQFAAFTPEGNIADAALAKRFEDNIVAFMNLVEAAKHYPCMKKAWVEFLGEQTDALTERIE